jgi:hypothetical protein
MFIAVAHLPFLLRPQGQVNACVFSSFEITLLQKLLNIPLEVCPAWELLVA